MYPLSIERCHTKYQGIFSHIAYKNVFLPLYGTGKYQNTYYHHWFKYGFDIKAVFFKSNCEWLCIF